jgi:hypothetical protein
MLAGTTTFGDIPWYEQGARFLIEVQKPDGSWGRRAVAEQNTWDTCFAILFLKKATRGIASVDAKRK